MSNKLMAALKRVRERESLDRLHGYDKVTTLNMTANGKNATGSAECQDKCWTFQRTQGVILIQRLKKSLVAIKGKPNKTNCAKLQLCPSLRDAMGCSLPGSSVHGIFQARILEWVAISFSKTN